MVDSETLHDIQSFAKKQISAEKYPDAYHHTRLAKCDDCGIVPFSLTIEYHSGAKKSNFRGIIWAQCECGRKERIFNFTGDHRKPEWQEMPACSCGNTWFVVCECERFEGDEGLFGFFDEGVVVGKCSECGRNRVMVFTD